MFIRAGVLIRINTIIQFSSIVAATSQIAAVLASSSQAGQKVMLIRRQLWPHHR